MVSLLIPAISLNLTPVRLLVESASDEDLSYLQRISSLDKLLRLAQGDKQKKAGSAGIRDEAIRESNLEGK